MKYSLDGIALDEVAANNPYRSPFFSNQGSEKKNVISYTLNYCQQLAEKIAILGVSSPNYDHTIKCNMWDHGQNTYLGWSIGQRTISDTDYQDIEDYLLANTKEADIEISKAINSIFWDR